MRRALLFVIALSGCTSDLDSCDPEGSAFEVVYDAQGTPAIAGQALIIQSCGGGGFCHSDDIAEDERFGVPSGLAFDLTLASTTTSPNYGATARLSIDQARVSRMRDAIWSAVTSGSMPPQGVPDGVVREGLYDRFDADGVGNTPLPSLADPEGREILREWLACGAPVVERTRPRDDELPPVGFTVPACERRCVDPSWDALYDEVVAPSCATASCHDAASQAASLDLSTSSTRGALLDRLIASFATPPDDCAACTCGEDPGFSSMPLLTPGEPNASLLYRKVEPSRSCGSVMPLAGSPLSEQALCALRAWIACGAPATRGEAEPCLDAARVECGVSETDGEIGCIEPGMCVNAVDPSRG